MSDHPLFRLGDVSDVMAGDPAPQDPGAFAPDGPLFVRMQDVGNHHLNPELSASTDRLNPGWLKGNRLRLFPKHSILIPKSGASVNLNHRAKLATDAYVVSHLAVVIPNQAKVDPDYLFWWSVRYDPRAQVQVTSLPSLKLATLKEAKLPLPPLDEQRRIASILNRAANIERLRTQAADRFREFTPALFIKMFGDPVENPMEWQVKPLGTLVANGPQNGLYRPNSDYGSGVRILRIDGFYAGHVVDPEGWRRVCLDAHTVRKYALAQDDIVINRVNSRPFLGKSAIIPYLDEPAVFESNMMRLKVDSNRMLPKLLISMLQIDSIQHQIRLNAKDAINQSSINQTDVRQLSVIVPPLDLQHRYTEIIESTHDATGVAKSGSRVASTLTASLMDRLLGDGV